MASKKDAAHKKWFLALTEAEFITICRKWNEKNLNIVLPADAKDYDDYLEYFKSITPSQLKALFKTGKDSIGVEAYAALSRWVEIIGSPSKIEKIRRTRMAQNQEQNINEIAVGDDDEQFYEALIKQNVAQLNSSSVSQQEVARLTSNINIFRKELRSIRSRTIRKDTVLAKILDQADGVKPKVVKKVKTKPKAKKSVKKSPKTSKPEPKVTKKESDGKTTTRKPKAKN